MARLGQDSASGSSPMAVLSRKIASRPSLKHVFTGMTSCIVTLPHYTRFSIVTHWILLV